MTAWLLEFGANVHAKNYEGKTPLQLAEEKGHGDVVELLRARSGMLLETQVGEQSHGGI
jgi:ankyrin repeat protein